MAGGASHRRMSLGGRLRSWLWHHRSSAADSLVRLLKNPLGSLLIWLVIGIALALPVGLWVMLDNVRAISGQWDSPARISLFLKPEVSMESARQIRNIVIRRKDVDSARLVSREEALEEFQQLSGFGDVLENLDENPLPHLILVNPARTDNKSAAILQRILEREAGVAQAVLDMAWLQRLNALMHLGQRLVLLLAAILILGVLLVIGNIIRLAIENRRDEILVVKLVGGSDAFVRRPFLYAGLWYGLGGAIVSWVTVSLALAGLREPLASLSLLYQSSFHLRGLDYVETASLLFLGSMMGLFGARVAVARHLGAIEPD